jgi:hypothetical protein
VRFRHILDNERVEVVAHRAIYRAAALAWVGHGLEGMTALHWLRIAGLNDIAASLEGTHEKHLPRLQGMDATTIAASTERQLEALGMKTATDRVCVRKAQDSFRRLGFSSVYGKPMGSFHLIGYYSDDEDVRSIGQCLTDAYPTILGVLSIKFPHSERRVEVMAKALLHTTFPVSLMQLGAFCAKYKGKPAQAQDNITELLHVPTTSLGARERDAYVLLMEATIRLRVLLNNLRLAGLSQRLQEVLTCAAGMAALSDAPTLPLISTVTTSSNAWKQRPSHWGQAAYTLRLGAIELVLRYVNSAIEVQRIWRGYRRRRDYKAFLTQRLRAVLLAQRLWRGLVQRRERDRLLAQMHSKWEQLWNDSMQKAYYRHIEDDTVRYEAPEVPYRPLVRHYYSHRLVQAWWHLLGPSEAPALLRADLCMVCGVRRYTRECLRCEDRKRFCYACWHLQGAHAGNNPHTFVEAGTMAVGVSLCCCVCGAGATRKCLGLIDASMIDSVLISVKQASESHTSAHSLGDAFHRTNALVLPGLVGDHKLKLLIEQLQKPDAGLEMHPADMSQQTLKQLRLSLEKSRAECDECYCDTCYQKQHTGGRRKLHK